MFQYLKKFDLIPVFSEEEFKHWFLPQPGIVDAYIVETDGEITGTKFQIYIVLSHGFFFCFFAWKASLSGTSGCQSCPKL